MLDGFYILLAVFGGSAFVLIVVAWIRGENPLRLGKPSYEELLAEKAKLYDCVVDWRYPDGSFIPQHKRMRMFKELHRLSYKISKHPGNPSNQGRQQTQQEPGG